MRPSDPWKTSFLGLVFVGRIETTFSHFEMQTTPELLLLLQELVVDPSSPRNTPGIEISVLLNFAKTGEMYLRWEGEGIIYRDVIIERLSAQNGSIAIESAGGDQQRKIQT